jgi:hypothetical protein
MKISILIPTTGGRSGLRIGPPRSGSPITSQPRLVKGKGKKGEGNNIQRKEEERKKGILSILLKNINFH